MSVTIFLPGIMGSELKLGNEEVWPPTVGEAVGGYGRIDKLIDPAVVHGDIIEKVACFRVYKPLLKTLRKTAAGERFVEFPYDWRQNLFDTAERLADRIDTEDDGGDIRIVAHSMGGLISRILLESGNFGNRPWFGRVSLLITLATPHRGAPLALVRILGIEGALGVSPSDTKRLANDLRYPSAYQLLPAPDDQAAWDLRTQIAELVDIYGAGGAVLNLEAALLAEARRVHDVLSAGNRPPGTRYFSFVATGHDTATRVNIIAFGSGLGRTEGDDAGDGTVPMWSAAAGSAQKQVAAGEHGKFFHDDDVRARIADLLGRTPDLFARARTATTNTVALSVNKPVFDATDQSVEVLVVPSRPVGQLSGELIIEPVDPALGGEVTIVPLDYSGPQITRLTVQLAVPTVAGAYAIRYDGTPPGRERVGDAFAVRERDG